MPDAPNHYARLQVSPLAGQRDIEAAFRKLAREFHPDINPDPKAAARMAAINAAYAVLRDPAQRAQYDHIRRNAFAPRVARDPLSDRPFDRPEYALYPPLVEWTPAVLELEEIRPGRSVSGVVTLRNAGGGTLSGNARTSSPQLRVSPPQFSGNEVVLRVEATLAADDRPRRTQGQLAWRIAIESNGGEGAVTVRAPYVPPPDERSRLERWTYRVEVAAVALLAALLILWPLWSFAVNR